MRIAAAALCLLCIACPGDPPARPEPPGRAEPSPAPAATAVAGDPTLRWAISEPTSIVPIDAVTADDVLVVDALYDSLTQWSDDLRVRPSVARRWERRARGRSWRFHLDPAARFSDGTPVTARSFVRTWNALAGKGAAHHHLRDVAGYRAVRSGTRRVLRGVRAVGSSILDVRLSRPFADFPAVVAHPALGPMRDPAVRGNEADQPIGNGPFRMAQPWAHDRFVRLTRVDGRQPTDALGTPVHEVVFQIADPVSAYIAYEQGAVDVATVPPGGLDADFAPAEADSDYRGPGLLRGELPTVYLLTFNTRRRPFDDVDARRGVALALDRPRLVADVFESNASPGTSASPPVLPGARQRTCIRCVHDPGRAHRLLRKAGVRRLTLWINTGGEHEAVADHVRRDLRAVGVRVDIRAVEFDRFRRKLGRGEAGLFRFGWTTDYPTLDNALRPLFHSSSTPARGGSNYGRYRDSDVDALLDAAARQERVTAKIELYRRAEDIIVGRDQAIIPVAVLRRRTVVSDRIRYLAYGPMGTADLLRVRIVERDG